MKKNYANLIAGLIIGLSAALALASAWNDSVIVDEVPHIGAGYSYLVKQDMRLNPEHPPLAKDLAALPLLFLNLKQDAFDTHFWTEDINGQWELGRKLIFNSGNNADLITRAVKIPMLVFFVLSAILIFIWTRQRYGERGGWIALLLFSFSPTVITHTRLVTTDIAALFGVLFASHFFLRYLQQPSRKNFWIATAFFGIALLGKFSTFLLAPFFLLLAVLWGINNTSGFKAIIVSAARWAGRSILIMIVGFMVVVWPVYLFHTWHYPAERQYRDTQNLMQSFGKRYLADPVVWASDKPVLRAAAQYGLGLLMVTQRSAGGNTTYFLGEVSRFGWRSYFPIVYFIKETLAWWIFAIAALLFLSWQVEKSFWRSWKKISGFISGLGKKYFTEMAMLLWLAVYWGSSIYSTLNIGVRHLLPTFPFAIMLVSGQLANLTEKLKNSHPRLFIAGLLTITALLTWHICENLSVYPFYLAYFNEVAGGPSGGYRYVVDSNLDWGQDLKRLGQWVKESNLSKIEVDYFGWADPAYYLKDRYIWMSSSKYSDSTDFIRRNGSNGWLAVSATFLQGSQGPPDEYRPVNHLWLKNYTPVTTIGHSIFIYRIQ